MEIDESRKKEFNDALAGLVELATVSGNKLTTEQIKFYFKDIIEDEDRYKYIYSYLKELKIGIDNVDVATVIGKAETDEAKAFYNMYIKDLEEIKKGDIEKEDKLARLTEGDKDAAKDLTELYLPTVLEIADEYINSPLGKSDLVAEGNLILFEYIVTYNGGGSLQEFEKNLQDKIRRGIETAIGKELGTSRTADHLADRINALNDITTEIAETTGREPSLDELTQRLGLSEDEVKALMKISIDALTIDEGK